VIYLPVFQIKLMATKKSFLFFLIFLFLASHSSFAQVWKKQAKSVNAGLLDLAFISKSTGFVLSSGKVLKTTDTGKSWTQILSSYNNFLKIQFVDNQNGYIIGHDDLVLKTNDGGNNWTLKRTGNSDDDLVTIFAKNRDTVFVAGPDDIDNNDSTNYINYTYNGGNSWSRRSLNSKQTLSSINMWNKSRGFICLSKGGLLQTDNGFLNYNQNNSLSIRIKDSKIIKDSLIIIVGDSGKIARSTNYGKTFNLISSSITEDLAGVHFANDSFGMACGAKGTILFTQNSGASWTKMTTNTQLNFSKIHVINPFLAWAVAYSTSGDSLDIFKYEDKSCLSEFVHVPNDTVICDKLDFEARFEVKGLNKPTWTINDALTNLNRKNDTIAKIYSLHDGKFKIFYELMSCDEIKVDTTTIYFWYNPKISVKDSLYCGAVKDNISFSCFACQYLWSTGYDGTSLTVSTPGKYWVKVTNHCKTISDTFELQYLPYVKLNLGSDTILCNQAVLNLNNSFKPGKYVWNDADTNSFKIINKQGTYSVYFENKCNKISDTINVFYKKTPSLDLGNDSVHCTAIYHTINLDSIKGTSNLKWNDGSSTLNRSLNQPGNYSAIISNECGEASDSIELKILTVPKLNIGRDTIYCQNFSHIVKIDSSASEFRIEWWDGKDSINRSFSTEGDYFVKVFNRCGEISDTIKIERKTKPEVDLGKDTILSKPFEITLDAKNTGSSYLWNTGSTSKLINISDYGNYSVTVSNYCGIDEDTISISKPLSVLGNSKGHIIKVYPNPIVNEMITIENLDGDFELELYNQYGKVLIKETMRSGQNVISLGHISKGVYYIKLSSEGYVYDIVRVLK
jgi:photosystem II stability/assembly factor-like uncharacterized protein